VKGGRERRGSVEKAVWVLREAEKLLIGEYYWNIPETEK
jgi:hypothetical protein